MSRLRLLAWMLGLGVSLGWLEAQAPVIYPQLGQQLGQGYLTGARSAVVAFAPDGSRLASSSDASGIKLWDVETGRELQTLFGHGGAVSGLVFLPSGDRLLSGSEDGTLQLWDLPSGRSLRVFSRHTERVRAIVLDPQGLFAASLSSEAVMLWDLQSGKLVRSWGASAWEGMGNRKLPFTDLAITPDGMRVVATSLDGSIRAWSISNGKLMDSICREDLLLGTDIKILGFTPEGWVIVGDFTHVLHIDLHARKKQADISASGAPLVLSRDQKWLLSWPLGLDKPVHVMDWAERKDFLTIPMPDYPMRLALSPDGRRMAAIGLGNALLVFDVGTGKRLQDFTSQARIPSGITFSRDGKFITIQGSQAKKPGDALAGSLLIARRWNLQTARLETEYDALAYSKSVLEQQHSARTEQEKEKARLASDDLMFHDYRDTGVYAKGGVSYQLEYPFQGATLTLWRIPNDPSNPYSYNRKSASWQQLAVLRPHGSSAITAAILSVPFKLMATGSDDKSIKLLEFPSGRELRTLTGHLGTVNQLTFSPDGKWLLSCSLDGTARLWDVARGTEMAQFVSFSDGEWIIVTPEGYYSASANGDRHLNVRVGTATYGIDNYRESFFRPDLVRLVLGGGSLSGYRSLADVKLPPKVTIVQTPARVGASECTLTLALEDQGGGLGDVRVFLNGAAVLSENGRSVQVVPAQGQAVLRRYTLKLAEGLNSIRAVAFNSDNTMQSDGAAWTIMASFTPRQKPALHALVVGIQDFRNPKLQLKYAVADANLFADTLERGSAGLFEAVKVRRLTTRESTTKGALQAALLAYRTLSPEDLFILYVASHGTVDEGEYFLLPSNIGALSTQRLRQDGLSQGELKELVANIPSTKKLIVIDTCNAGQLGQALQAALLTRGMSEDTAIKVLSRAVGSTILSASTSVQEALEGYQGHGLFTWALVEGLKGKADKGSTGFVKTTDLAAYVEDQVPELAERLFRRAQFPTVSISGQGFPVGKSR